MGGDCGLNSAYSRVTVGHILYTQGDVGKEMYVVSSGLLEVLGGPLEEKVLSQVKSGGAFGQVR